MNYTTRVITKLDYLRILEVMERGFSGFMPKPKVAFALYLEANLGLRIGDVLRLCRANFVVDSDVPRVKIYEQKTKKLRNYPISKAVYSAIGEFTEEHKLNNLEPFFNFKIGCVNYNLRQVCAKLGYSNVSTHSFRKLFATTCYENSGKDIILVQNIMQHSSVNITQRYIGVKNEEIMRVLESISF